MDEEAHVSDREKEDRFVAGASVEQRFAVQFEYPVHFVRHAFDVDNDCLARTFDRLKEGRRHRVVVYVDSGLLAAQPALPDAIAQYFEAYGSVLEMAGGVQVFPGGTMAKRGYAHLNSVLTQMGNLHLDRQSFVLAIGGGSMLDALGMAVALVHRGVRLVRMPSTVLAQNDAGVGVKNGVDEHGQKNFLGTFAPPFAVVNDLSLLNSLTDEHWRGGISEAFKVALIKDASFFDFLTEHAQSLRGRDETAMATLVQRCAQIHLEHIATNGDPFEMGASRPLDFGHWSAHRLEVLSGGAIGHGQAVAIGIALDCVYARRKELIDEETLMRVLRALKQCGLPLWCDELCWQRADGEYEVLQGLRDFQEHLGGRLCITLPDGIGKRVEVHHMNEDWVIESAHALKSLEASL